MDQYPSNSPHCGCILSASNRITANRDGLTASQRSRTTGHIDGPRQSLVRHRHPARHRFEIANTIRLTPTGPTIARGESHLLNQSLLGVIHHSGRLIVWLCQPMAMASNAELAGGKRIARVYMDEPGIGGRRQVPFIKMNCRSRGRGHGQYSRANRCQRIQQKQAGSIGHQNLH